MSAVARPQLAVREFQSVGWVASSLAGAEFAALATALSLGLLVRWLAGPLLRTHIGPEQYLGIAAGILALPIVHYQLGLYPGYCLGPVERLRRRLLATVAVFGGLVAFDNLVQRGEWSRGVLLSTFVFALFLPALAEAGMRWWLIQTGRWGIPVLLLGAGETGASIAKTLSAERQLGLVPIAFLDDTPRLWNTFVETLPVLGPMGLASDFAERAEAVIVALPDIGSRDVGGLLNELNFPRVIVVPNFTGMQTLWVTARDLGGALGLEIKRNLLLHRNLVLKHFMDRAIGIPLLVASLPLLALLALCIKIVSPRGTAFYRQRRQGLDGRVLNIWKLRTMHPDADAVLAEWLREHPVEQQEWTRYFKLRHDPRVLPFIGTILRRFSLDELPQLINVVRGEMSLVGPRPLPEYHLEQFPREFRELRTRVLPGITGLWQVTARSNGDLAVQESLDTYYIRNWSPWLDVYLLARTVSAVLLARGAY
ncbi:MAG: exopolysaccharide biosynthesis polyprenyl glycosylphosphotransferase [Bryobacteraceae bacterium]